MDGLQIVRQPVVTGRKPSPQSASLWPPSFRRGP